MKKLYLLLTVLYSANIFAQQPNPESSRRYENGNIAFACFHPD